MFSRLRSFLTAWTRRERFEDSLDEEVRFHLDAYAEDRIRSGLPGRETLRRARIHFGSLEGMKDDCRQARGLRLADEIKRDTRHAGRFLRRLTISVYATRERPSEHAARVRAAYARPGNGFRVMDAVPARRTWRASWATPARRSYLGVSEAFGVSDGHVRFHHSGKSVTTAEIRSMNHGSATSSRKAVQLRYKSTAQPNTAAPLVSFLTVDGLTGDG